MRLAMMGRRKWKASRHSAGSLVVTCWGTRDTRLIRSALSASLSQRRAVIPLPISGSSSRRQGNIPLWAMRISSFLCHLYWWCILLLIIPPVIASHALGSPSCCVIPLCVHEGAMEKKICELTSRWLFPPSRQRKCVLKSAVSPQGFASEHSRTSCLQAGEIERENPHPQTSDRLNARGLMMTFETMFWWRMR